MTPAEATECPYCSYSSPEAVAAKREEARLRNFAQALLKRSSPFTFLFIGMNLGVFALMWLAGGMGSMSTDHQVLIEFGAKENSLIDGRNQYWRLVTCIFIHIGFLHLFFNNYALWIVGQEIERLYGSSRFVLLYLVTGIAGSVASYSYNPGATSAGASGAIFGLFGVLAAFAFRYRTEIPKVLRQAITRRVIPIIAINLIIGFSAKQIDDSAHIGGLVTGILLVFVVPYKRPQEKATALVWRGLMSVCMAIIIGSSALAFHNYKGPGLRFANLAKSPGNNVQDYLKSMGDADTVLRESFNLMDAIIDERNENADAEAAEAKVERGIKSLSDGPQIGGEANEFRQRLLALLTEQQEIIGRFSASNQKDWDKFKSEETALKIRFIQFSKDIETWLGQ